MQFRRPERLDDSHKVDEFDCGNDTLNHWLRRWALQNQAARMAAVHVICDEAGRVAAYAALANGHLTLDEAAERLRKGVPRHPIPVVVLARLAVDNAYQGAGLGTSMMEHVFYTVVLVADQIGCQALIIHAKDDAARAWYDRFGVEPLPENPLHIYLMMKDIAKTLRMRQ